MAHKTPPLLNAFIQGWKTGIDSWRVGLIVYVIQFLLAMMLGVLVASELIAPINNSLELKKLLHGYDHTVISDLANVHGDFMRILTGGLPWLVLIWMIFSIFINGGLLFTIERKEPSWDIFWAGGARYFVPFLQMGLFFLIIVLLLSVMIWAPLIVNFESIIKSLPSEREYIFILIGVFVLYVFFMLFIYAWSVSSRFFYLKRNLSVWKTIKTAFHFVRKNFRSTEGMLLIFALIQLIVVVLYWFVESNTKVQATSD